MDKILITPRSVTRGGHPALQRLTDQGFEIVFSTPGVQPDEEELLKLLPDCVGMLAGTEKITRKVLRSAKKLKAISRNGVGINNIDLAAAKELGIKILTTPGANARGVAELTFGLILTLVRSIAFADRCMKQQDWQRRKGIELQGRTLGIIGCGNIGKLVAKFALAFNMKVLAYDPYKDESFNPSKEFRYSSLKELFECSDIISLHCPLTSDNKSLINKSAIDKMKDGVYLVNTARAELVEKKAVIEALKKNKIAGVAMDVFEQEPPDDWSLVSNSRVVATPHIGGYTKESINRAVYQAVDNLINALK